MARLVRQALRKLLSRTRWSRERRRGDPFSVTRSLIREPAPIILDVGAHVGESALRYRSLFPTALIHCFEPYPASFERLSAACRNDPRIVPHCVAVAAGNATAQLHVNRESQTNSLLASDQRGNVYWGPGLLDTQRDINVDTVSLDAFCDQNGVRRVDVLKVDTQGSEYAVLEGARSLLERKAIDLIYIELLVAPSYVGQRKFHFYLTFLDTHGYALFDLFNLGHHDGRLTQADAIFVTTEFLERLEGARADIA